MLFYLTTAIAVDAAARLEAVELIPANDVQLVEGTAVDEEEQLAKLDVRGVGVTD